MDESDDLGWPWSAVEFRIFSEFPLRTILQISETTKAKRMKVETHIVSDTTVANYYVLFSDVAYV